MDAIDEKVKERDWKGLKLEETEKQKKKKGDKRAVFWESIQSYKGHIGK